MAQQGAKLTPELIERIRAEYVLSGGKLRHCAKVLGVSTDSVRKYGPPPADEWQQLRTHQTRVAIETILDKMSQVQAAILDAMMAKAKLDRATFQELAVATAILVDKRAAIADKADHADTDTDTEDDVASRIDELAARRRQAGDLGQPQPPGQASAAS